MSKAVCKLNVFQKRQLLLLKTNGSGVFEIKKPEVVWR